MRISVRSGLECFLNGTETPGTSRNMTLTFSLGNGSATDLNDGACRCSCPRGAAWRGSQCKSLPLFGGEVVARNGLPCSR